MENKKKKIPSRACTRLQLELELGLGVGCAFYDFSNIVRYQ